MINVLYFCSDYLIGLTQAQTSTLVEMCKHTDKLHIVPLSSQNEQEVGLFKKLEEHRIKPEIISDLDTHERFKVKCKQIAYLISKYDIEVVNVQNNWQLALVTYVRYILRPRKFKVVYTIHGYRHNSSIKQIPAIAMIGAGLFFFADRVISMSSYVSKRFWFVGWKTDLVFYMMTQPAFNKPTNHIEGSPLRLIFPAQFRKGKNQKMIIRAVEEYIKATGDKTIELILPGNGYLLHNCKEYVNAHGLENNVSFPGKLSLNEVIALTEQCNVAVISSNVETYGRCITEPFCLGRCVVTRPTGIAKDIIKHKKNGFFFNKEKELKQVLIKLHNNPELLTSCANQAFEDKKIFKPRTVFYTYLNSIERCLKRPLSNLTGGALPPP